MSTAWRRAGWIACAAWLAAGCRVQIDDYFDRACDESHACLDGRVCYRGACVLPEDAPEGEDACPVIAGAMSAIVETPPLALTGDPATQLGFSSNDVSTAEDGTLLLSYESYFNLGQVVRVATSTNGGATWEWLADVVQSVPIQVTTSDTGQCGATTCDGYTGYGSTTIVHDPSDPDANARYKLFTEFLFLRSNGTGHAPWGHIDRFVAPSPQGPWSPATKLLGWLGTSPESSDGASQILNATGPNTHCINFSTPHALVHAGGIDLYVSCIYVDGSTPRISTLLYRSTDHAQSFQYVSLVVDGTDPDCMVGAGGYFVSAKPFEHDGRRYLVGSALALDGSTLTAAGCIVFRTADTETGELDRFPSGRLAVHRRMTSGTLPAGSCVWTPGLQTGYIAQRVDPDAALPTDVLRLMQTDVIAP